MEATSLAEIILAISGASATVGMGVRWLLAFSEKRVSAVQDRLEKQYAERFQSSDELLAQLRKELEQCRRDLASYHRHVGRMEGLLLANGVEVPKLEDADVG